MLLLTRVRRNGRVDMLVVMGEENIERIKQYDPVEIMWGTLPPEYSMRMPATIAVTFATAEEMKQVEQMSVSDPAWKERAFAMLTRGFQFRPEAGDHDFGPTVLGNPTEGTKQ